VIVAKQHIQLLEILRLKRNLGHEFDFSGARDFIGYVTISFHL